MKSVVIKKAAEKAGQFHSVYDPYTKFSEKVLDDGLPELYPRVTQDYRLTLEVHSAFCCTPEDYERAREMALYGLNNFIYKDFEKYIRKAIQHIHAGNSREALNILFGLRDLTLTGETSALSENNS